VRGDITWNNRSTIEISSGEEDYYLGLFIAKLRAFVSGSDTILGTGDDRRVYLRLAHEMNGGWYTYSQGENTPEEYIKMWRYIFALVRAAELTQDHVSFMWCVHTYDGVPGAPAEAWYPGDEFVDWFVFFKFSSAQVWFRVGIDGYNFDTSNYGTFWQSPYDVFFSMLDRMKLYKKPIAIPEFGTVPRFIDDPTHRCFNRLGLEQKSEWLRQALEMIHENSVIRMISYFNINKRDGGTPLGQAWGIFTSSLQNASDCEQLCYCASGTSRFTARSGITYETFPVFREELRAMKPFLILGSQQNPRILDSRVFQGKNPKRPSIKRTDF